MEFFLAFSTITYVNVGKWPFLLVFDGTVAFSVRSSRKSDLWFGNLIWEFEGETNIHSPKFRKQSTHDSVLDLEVYRKKFANIKSRFCRYTIVFRMARLTCKLGNCQLLTLLWPSLVVFALSSSNLAKLYELCHEKLKSNFLNVCHLINLCSNYAC